MVVAGAGVVALEVVVVAFHIYFEGRISRVS